MKINVTGVDQKKIEKIIRVHLKKRGKEAGYKNVLPKFAIVLPQKNEYNIITQRMITSHRKIVGPLLIKIRALLDEEIQRSIYPTIQKQAIINKKMFDMIEKIEEKIKSIEIKLKKKEQKRKKHGN